MHIHDVIVIGAGAMGSAAAYHLAKAGAQVLLLEQFQHGHRQGSSHGETRGIRLAYDKPFYTRLMQAAYREWHALERAAARQLLYVSGGIVLAEQSHPLFAATEDSLTAAGIEVERWDAAQLARLFPQLRVPATMDIMWQKDSGVLHASACIATHLQLAQQHGAVMRTGTSVTHIDGNTQPVTVHLESERLKARKVVVTAGAWTGRLLAQISLPLTVTRQQVVYYQAPADFGVTRFPTLIEFNDTGEFYYGIPAFGAEGLKLARHGGGATVTPDSCVRTPDDDYIAQLDRHFQELLPARGAVAHAEVCLYTETPDSDFIIDTHPHCAQVLIAAGFSGHGFKFSALVGRILGELALHGETDYDVQPFRIARFAAPQAT